MVPDDNTGLPDDVIEGIDAELERRFAPHAGDPLYDEIRRVRRSELIAAEVEKAGGSK